MSQQMALLRNLIASAHRGNEGALTLLRRICRLAADEAPSADLISLAQCLYSLGEEAARRELGRN